LKNSYEEHVSLFKALADVNRLMIIDMLSCGEMCACEILDKFKFTQPTLSHHMKSLCDCGLVNGRRDGKWTYYSLDQTRITELKDFIQQITTSKSDCICKCKCDNGLSASQS
jgi:ArsR family transcriptional regulator